MITISNTHLIYIENPENPTNILPTQNLNHTVANATNAPPSSQAYIFVVVVEKLRELQKVPYEAGSGR